MGKILLGYYACLNLVAFLLMGWDKNRAQRNKWRISEKTLLIAALAGGAPGAYGAMQLFHHKTKHWYFRATFLFAVFLHLVLIWRLVRG